MITLNQLEKIIPKHKNTNDWYNSLNKFLPIYKINTVNRISAFLSQCMIESEDFTVLEENLNYRADQLLRIWPNKFVNLNMAKLYANNPQKIANYIYSNRMGNGNIYSNDGYNYRGRGLIQITGKSNYLSLSKDLKIPFVNITAYMSTIDGAVQSACWFWNMRRISVYADVENIVNVTKLVNGGLIGYNERYQKYLLIKKLIND